MHRWKVASALGKLNSCTRLATKPAMPPGTTCSPTSKDTTIVSGSIPPSGISPPNRQSAKPLNPVSTKSQEGQFGVRRSDCRRHFPCPAELGSITPHAMHNHGEPSCQCDDGFFLPPTLGNVHRPCLLPRPFLHAGQHDLRGLIEQRSHGLVARVAFRCRSPGLLLPPIH